MKNPRAGTNLRGTSGRGSGTLPSLIALGNVVLIIASLYWAQAVLIPIALVDLADLFVEPGRQRLGTDTALGRLPSVILIVVLTFSPPRYDRLGCYLELTSLGNEIPKYTVNIKQKIADVRGAGHGGCSGEGAKGY